MNETTIIHESPWSDWFATQDLSRGVSLHERGGNRSIILTPPPEWEAAWAWNVTEDGAGIYFRRTN